jgi:hypothetical protein
MATPLGNLYSRIDAYKRGLFDMVRNPSDALSMLGGRIVESERQAEALRQQAFNNPNRPFQVTDPQAMQQLTDMYMSGPLGFAPAGIVKPEIAAKVLPQTQVVDEAGKPKIMYHGTRESFEEFEPGTMGAVFATPDNEEFLRPYLGRFFNQKTGKFEFAPGANVRPVYIDAKKPFDFENKDHVESVVQWIKDNLPDSSDIAESIGKKIVGGEYYQIERPSVQKAIRGLGFDGFFVNENGVKNIAVFDPKQIKSALSDPSFEDVFTNPLLQDSTK